MGAATCLLVAGTLAMTLASGLIAFNGWPGLGVQDVSEQAALVADVSTGTGAKVTAAPLRMRPPAPAPRISPPRARRPAVVTSSRTTAQPGPASARTRPSGSDSKPRPPKPPVKNPPPPTPQAPAPGEPVRNLSKALDTTLDSTGKVVAGLITPTAPVVGTVVQNTTDVAGDLLGRAVDVVGTIVDGLGPPPAGTP